jgi:hypothetical protein
MLKGAGMSSTSDLCCLLPGYWRLNLFALDGIFFRTSVGSSPALTVVAQAMRTRDGQCRRGCVS